VTVSTDKFTKASESLNRLAKALKCDGQIADSEKYFEIAAELELLSPDLQRCWGGPFNGQEERIRIMGDLLRDLQPDRFVETGCFRGLSTSWIAKNYKGPIYTCEIERMYAIQAVHNTNTCGNVNVILDDSRSFLSHILDESQVQRNVLFYLDAHWEHDLPLAQELDIIFKSNVDPVIVIDDFMVPDDLTYGWDDYGEGKSLDVRMLVDHMPDDVVVYFPRLKGEEETGAKRGCCIIARSSQALRITSTRLRSASLDEWLARMEPTSVQAPQQTERPVEDANISYPQLVQILREENDRLNSNIDIIERDRAKRLSDITALGDQVRQKNAYISLIEKDRAGRLLHINFLTDKVGNLNETIETIESDRVNRYNDVLSLNYKIRKIENYIEIIELDRVARIADVLKLRDEVERLTAHIEFLERDSAQRLDDVHALTAVIERMRKDQIT
jgi:predicted O-methyltransferase YrrM